jgi:AbrB family looped-hinge helix DNA binding protein
MKAVIAAFAGSAGSGKSTIAGRVASILRWPHTSFGDHVRNIATQRGLAGTRDELQEIGANTIEERGPRGFCEDVISASQWRSGSSLIIDGLRHKQIYEALKEILRPIEVIVIFVEADDATRAMRLRGRGEVYADGVRQIDLHRVERQIPELPKLATLVVDGAKREEIIADEVTEFLATFCELPLLRSNVTDGYHLRIPRAIREKLNLRPGDRLDFDEVADHLSARKAENVPDPDRIRSVIGTMSSDLKDVDRTRWLDELRGPVELPKE